MQTYTHFRTVFDVSPAAPMDNAWVALVGQVRAWVARKEGAPLKGFFFKVGVWTGPSPKRAKVETRVLYEGDLATPDWRVDSRETCFTPFSMASSMNRYRNQIDLKML